MGQDDMEDINRQIEELTATRTVAIARGDSTDLEQYDEQIRALFTKAKRTAINRKTILANNAKQRDSSRSNISALSSKSTKPTKRSDSSKLNNTLPSASKGRADYVEAVRVEEYAKNKANKGANPNKKPINGHVFKTVSVGVPSTCHHCKKSILGSIRSTSKCTNKQCSILVHKKCRELCSPCPQ
ncbi:hypothetical protein SARC_00405 [Sphaeroforma arctica JP610]|uniref:Phorbol-ester/DAG-type domain-containing protein n=1 Tax=Sphaeroforma arctica JP610 TaxID=667725 RepID=A0A0L0GEM6_9EUKA|nr:hypothetical protein SARC_00405 [Sphaeroforma arctica JP610]KNC87470.1 hypothetical protein SARC_00405 [Sphaeroforma arctica JP610]|eukprot:XP_014161372.1 hypothetical protein SARC_00405 [Sphaeroforma arctica JP610]